MKIASRRIGPDPHIAVDICGEGEWLFLLHGIGGNKRNWALNIEEFGRHFKTVAWDARGYGESDDYQQDLVFGDFAEDLARVMDHFGAGKAHLLGLSMGGRIALSFYEKHPGRVSSLTLCDTYKGFRHFSKDQQEEFIRLRKEPLLAGKEPRDIAPVVAETLIGNPENTSAFAALVDSMSRLHKESYIKSIEASVHSDHTDNLDKIDIPTLVVVGSEDRLTPPSLAREITAQIPSARLEIIAGAGHLSNIEEPEAFNQVVLDFLLNLPD
ncbi:alpha/beta fold hydrolase [Alphaproteobacteria bacterium LSUCC0684]